MANTKVASLKYNSFNSVSLKETLVIPVYYDSIFYCVLPMELEPFVIEAQTTDRKFREGGKSVYKKCLKGESPEKIDNLIYSLYASYYEDNVKEEKVICFRFKFNSGNNYFNHENKISFADTPAMSLNWHIKYHVSFPDGRKYILSHPYKNFGHIVSSKTREDVEKYKEKWIFWTEEREAFFQSITDALESMIKKVNTFFTKDNEEIAILVDSKQFLLT